MKGPLVMEDRNERAILLLPLQRPNSSMVHWRAASLLWLLAESRPSCGYDGRAGQVIAQCDKCGAGSSGQHALWKQVSVCKTLPGVDDGTAVVHDRRHPAQGLPSPKCMTFGQINLLHPLS